MRTKKITVPLLLIAITIIWLFMLLSGCKKEKPETPIADFSYTLTRVYHPPGYMSQEHWSYTFTWKNLSTGYYDKANFYYGDSGNWQWYEGEISPEKKHIYTAKKAKYNIKLEICNGQYSLWSECIKEITLHK